MSEKDSSISDESWDGLLGNYFKAEEVTEKEGKVPCIGLSIDENDRGEPTICLTIEYKGKKKLWDLNMTNRKAIKDSNVTKPKDVIGQFIYFEKSRAMNPSLKKEVPVLRIVKVSKE